MRRLSFLLLLAASIACGQVYRVGDRLFVQLGNYSAFAGDGAGGACVIGNLNNKFGVHRIFRDGTSRFEVDPNDPQTMTGLSLAGEQFVACNEKQIWFTGSVPDGRRALILKEDGLVFGVLIPNRPTSRIENGVVIKDQVVYTVSSIMMKNGRLMAIYRFMKPDDPYHHTPAFAEIDLQTGTPKTLFDTFQRQAAGIKTGSLGCITNGGSHWAAETNTANQSKILLRKNGSITLEISVKESIDNGATCEGASAFIHFKDERGKVHIEKARDGSNVREDVTPLSSIDETTLSKFEWSWAIEGKLVFLMETSAGKNALVEIDPSSKSGEVIKHSEVAPAGLMTEMHPSGSRLLVKIGSEVYMVLSPSVPDQTFSAKERETVRMACRDCYLANRISPQAFLGDRPVEVIPHADYIDLKVPASLTAGEYPIRIKINEIELGTEINLKLKIERSIRAVVESVSPATFQGDVIAQGGLFTIKGKWLTGMVSDPNFWFSPMTYAFSTPWPAKLGAVRVLVGGKPVPLQLAVTWTNGDSQINGQYPLTSDSEVAIEALRDVNSDEVVSRVVVHVKVLPVAATLFGNQDFPVILQNFSQDAAGNTLVSRSAPARPGDWLVAYGTGFGTTNPTIEPGKSPKSSGINLARVEAQVRAWIKLPSGEYWEVQEILAFASPDFPGVTQVNFRLPPDLPAVSGTGYLILSVGGVTTDGESRYPLFF